MIVVALKTIFLIGIMSWYSAAIFSMINDYFRKEFNEYIKIDSVDTTYKSNTIQHTKSIPTIASPTVQIEMAKISQYPALNEKQNQKHSNQPDNNEFVAERPLIPAIKHLIFSNNGYCHLDEYTELLLKDAVCITQNTIDDHNQQIICL